MFSVESARTEAGMQFAAGETIPRVIGLDLERGSA